MNTANRLNITLWMIYFSVFLYVYNHTIISLYYRWSKFDESYGHGFLIVLIVIYLIITNRGRLKKEYSKPLYIASIPLVVLTLIWSFGYLTDIIIIEQLLLPIILLTVVALVNGKKIVKLLLFPILYIYFAIPIWDYINNYLLLITVYVVDVLIHWAGITALIEGNTITIPSGRIVVADGCSGLRYLIVCTALSVISSYLYIRNKKHKALIIIFGIFIGLLTNWLRVFALIIIGYVTEMKSPLLYDHEIFGWILFAILFSPIYFAISRLNDGYLIHDDVRSIKNNEYVISRGTNIFAWGIAFLLAFIVPVLVKSINISPGEIGFGDIIIESDAYYHIENNGLKNDIVFFDNKNKPNKIYVREYRKNNNSVGVAIGLYKRDGNNKDTLPYDAKIINENKYSIVSKKSSDKNIDNYLFEELEIINNITGSREVVWYWYQLGDKKFNNKYMAKISELYILLKGRSDGAFVLIKTKCTLSCDDARENIKALIPLIDSSIKKAVEH